MRLANWPAARAAAFRRARPLLTPAWKLNEALLTLLSRLRRTVTSSWLNQIERWFAEITRKRIRRGTFCSVRDLVHAIHNYVRHYNRNPQPFQWVASASRIIRKVNKYRQALETAD